jgi:hypothetical protein
MKFIALHQADGTRCFVNAAEIRALFPAGKGTSINIGTMGNIPVTENPQQVLRLVAEAFGYSD